MFVGDNIVYALFFLVLPELAANDQLMKFWKSVAKNDVSTSCRLQCLSENGGKKADKVPMLHQNHTHRPVGSKFKMVRPY